jgi:hypothetical protein
MDSILAGPRQPKFRNDVRAIVGNGEAQISLGARSCAFAFAEHEAAAVSRLMSDLETGGRTRGDLATRSAAIADKVPRLLHDFDDLRLLIESDPERVGHALSGGQLYREVRRLADRMAGRIATSAFHRALTEGRATRQQLIGYALEYYWIVQSAPGLIGPVLGTAHSAAERRMLQDFLKSELGHDRFLAMALKSVGITDDELEAHQPLPSTFALGASLGIYGRQHPLSFKASLFLFERAQPAFIDAFDDRCRALGMPDAFHTPLRAHANINDEYDHEDISRQLMELEHAVDAETCAVVKRHIAIMVETMIQQEEQILAYYGQDLPRIPRIFN